MNLNAANLKKKIDLELDRLSDERVLKHIRHHLIHAKVVMRDWQYGMVGQKYPCWTVLEHSSSNTGIAYCEEGFGPDYPWGLVSLSGTDASMGMDTGWFKSFLDAYFDSKPVTELPIWRVFQVMTPKERKPLSQEGAWAQTMIVVRL